MALDRSVCSSKYTRRRGPLALVYWDRPLVMTFQPFGQVLSGADIVGSVFFGLENIYEVGHGNFLWRESRPVNKKSLSHKR